MWVLPSCHDSFLWGLDVKFAKLWYSCCCIWHAHFFSKSKFVLFWRAVVLMWCAMCHSASGNNSFASEFIFIFSSSPFSSIFSVFVFPIFSRTLSLCLSLSLFSLFCLLYLSRIVKVMHGCDVSCWIIFCILWIYDNLNVVKSILVRIDTIAFCFSRNGRVRVCFCRRVLISSCVALVVWIKYAKVGV